MSDSPGIGSQRPAESRSQNPNGPGRPGSSPRVGLATIAREWTRIGFIGFGGPPAHIALLRQLVVQRRQWIDARSFEDANAACGLLPGPASTQLAILCAYRLGGPQGAIVGGLGFIVPAVILIIPAAALVIGGSPPRWLSGAAAGAGSAVAAVAVRAAWDLAGPSFARARARDDGARAHREIRWLAYLLVSMAAAASIGPYLVLVLLGCGLVELIVRSEGHSGLGAAGFVPAVVSSGGLGALAWTAFKVGALSFGGGFVIIPLMQGDAVHVHHWMTNSQFLTAVALGQVTPGPVVATVAAVGYAAHGVGGGILAALVAFAPSFCFVLAGGRHFDQLRTNRRLRAFLDGAGPAAIGAIFGAAITLAAALTETWQFILLAFAAVVLLALRRSVVLTLVAAAAVGVALALAGAPLP